MADEAKTWSKQEIEMAGGVLIPPERVPESIKQGLDPELTMQTTAPPPSREAMAMVPIGETGIVLKSLEDLVRFARMAVAGGVAPKGMSEGAAAIAIQVGLERGLGLLGGLQQCVVINGQLSWRGQGAYALIQGSPACKPGTLRFGHEGEGEHMVGFAVGWRVGYDRADRREFSVKDARQARLWGKAGPWQQYPGRMLAWKALGFLAITVFPDVLGGFPLAEEAADYEPVRPEKPPITAKVEPSPSASGPDPLLEALSVEQPGQYRRDLPTTVEPVTIPFEAEAEAKEAPEPEPELPQPTTAETSDTLTWDDV